MPTIHRRPAVLAALIALIGLATLAAGVYGLLHSPGKQTGAGHATATGSPPGRPASPGAVGEAPAALPKTSDPIRYARAVAAAIFDWSTASGYTPADYTAPVLASADPTSQELPGLIEDLTGYEPTSEQWTQLASMQVTQHLRIQSAAAPSLWPEALAQAHGRLPRGTTAVTISGVRDRSGIWYGQPAKSSEPVSFTIFMACRPAFKRCHVLRLSQLGDPLP